MHLMENVCRIFSNSFISIPKTETRGFIPYVRLEMLVLEPLGNISSEFEVGFWISELKTIWLFKFEIKISMKFLFRPLAHKKC